MQSATCALMPLVPEEGSRPCAPFGAHQEDSVFLKNSGTRGGGPWDREAKVRLPNSVSQIIGGADDLPEVRTPRRPQAARQNAALPPLWPAPDLPSSPARACLMGLAVLAIAVGLLAAFSIPLRRKP